MYELQKKMLTNLILLRSLIVNHDERLLNESRGLSAWPGWLRDEAKAKSQLRPTRMASLAWPIWAWLGRLFGLEPSHAQHYV